MGCAKSKNRSRDDMYPGAEMEGGAARYNPSRKSNESLIITVLWRRLSLFSRRGSVRKPSGMRTMSGQRAGSVLRSADSPDLELEQEQEQEQEQPQRPPQVLLEEEPTPPELDTDGESR